MRRASTAALATALAFGVGAVPAPVAANTFKVNTTGDSGNGVCDSNACTLREAITNANSTAGADEIVFDSSVTGTITLTDGELVITDELSITGPGANDLSITADSDGDGKGESRHFLLDTDSAVTISGVRLVNGYSADGGGSIYGTDCDLTLNDIVASNNVSNGRGGTVYAYSAHGHVYLDIAQSTFSDNISDASGGALSAATGDGFVALEVDSSQFNNNTASFGGAIFALSDDRELTPGEHDEAAIKLNVTNSQFSGNEVISNDYLNAGGGIGIFNEGFGAVEFTINASRFNDNTAYLGGGIFVYSASYLNLTIQGSQFMKNDTTYGGGIYIREHGQSDITIVNTTLANNTSAEQGAALCGVLGESDWALINSTVSGNSAAQGAIALFSHDLPLSLDFVANVDVVNTTITDNAASHGAAGVYARVLSDPPRYGPVASHVDIRSSIVAGNTGGPDLATGSFDEQPDVPHDSAYFWVSNSLIQDPGSAQVFDQGDNLIGESFDPMLAPLKDNGGPTLTHAIDASSPAFNAGDLLSDPDLKPKFDQRGWPATRVSGGTPDMGAFEVQVDPIRGLLYDRARNGHGMDLQKVGETYFFTFYTHADNRSPEWYQWVGETANGVLEGELFHFTYEDKVATAEPAGTAVLDFGAAGSPACNDETNRQDAVQLTEFSWTINDTSGNWCLEPLVVGGAPFDPNFTGTWYAGPDDSGWGLTISQQGPVLVAILYFYDGEGNPRWVLGSTQNFTNGDTLDMLQFTGYCRTCPLFRETEKAGTLTLIFNEPSQQPAGNLTTVDVSYLGPQDGGWERNDVPIRLLSDPVE